eukprot:9271909-Pyramimonas_sp.AAC.1
MEGLWGVESTLAVIAQEDPHLCKKGSPRTHVVLDILLVHGEARAREAAEAAPIQVHHQRGEGGDQCVQSQVELFPANQ